VLITDLRMGLEPNYTFSFVVAERASPLRALPVPESAGRRVDLAVALPWFWRRLGGEVVAPPR
jgi:inner membrane protein